MRMAFLKYHRISIDLSESQLLEMLANFDYGWFSEPTESPRGYIHKCVQIDHTLDPQGIYIYIIYIYHIYISYVRTAEGLPCSWNSLALEAESLHSRWQYV